jgi:AraC-like DNA-binding protein
MMQGPDGLRPLSFDGGRATPPLLSSAQAGWSSVPFELHRTAPSEVERSGGPPGSEHSLLVVVEGCMDVVLKQAGREVHHRCLPGSVSLHTPHDRPTLKRVTGSGNMLVVRLSSEWRQRVLPESIHQPLRSPSHAAPSVTLRSLALGMCEEAARGAPTGGLFADALSLAFLTCAVSELPLSPVATRGALSPDQQRRIQRYIDDHLASDLRVTELAAVCGLGVRQFSTVFRRAFGVSPYRHVIDRRVARGAAELTQRACDLSELAQRLGFSSASHFAFEFRRVHGISPRAFARSKRSIAGS